MGGKLTCEKCGGQLPSLATGPGARARCPACEAQGRVPADAVTTEKGVASACPECGATLPAGAVLCVNCGSHRGLGKRLKTRHKRARLVWDTSNTLVQRIVGFVGAALGIALVCVRLWDYLGEFAWWLLLLIPVAGALLLTPLGMTWRIILQRDRSGRFRLTKRCWICQIPVGGWSIRLDERDKAYIDYSPTYDDWGQEVGGSYALGVARDRQDAPFVLYKGTNERLTHDIADGLREVAGVRLERR